MCWLAWLVLVFVQVASSSAHGGDGTNKTSRCVQQWSSEDKQEGRGHLDIWVFLSSCVPSNQTHLSLATTKRRSLHGSLVDSQVPREAVEEIVGFGATLRMTSNWLCALSVRISSEEQLRAIAQLPIVSSLSCVAKAQVEDRRGRTSSRSPDSSSVALDGQKRGSAGDPLPDSSSPYGLLEKLLESVNVPAVHLLGFKGKGVSIMVVDAGFDKTHECFEQTKISAEYDFVDDDGDVGGPSSQTKHGTATLSVIAGNKAGKYVGIAPEATVVLARTESLEYERLIEEDFFVRALEWGESLGVNLVSSSLGYHTFWQFKDYNGKTSVASLAIEKAFKRGVVVVMSVGNYGRNNLATPADSRGALAVGSISASGLRSAFSSVGPTSDGRIKPDVVGPGESVPLADSASSGYFRNSGTSFSSPFVAGIAALVMQVHPDWTSTQVVEAIRRSSSNAMTPNIEIGWGLVNALRAIQYNTSRFSTCSGSCEYGDCSKEGTCVCEDLYYGVDCSFALVSCGTWCDHKCYENECYCKTLSQAKQKCINETIPGWSCANSQYNDGVTCDFCGDKLEDPDCKGFSLKDCGESGIPVTNLTLQCKKPLKFLSHDATPLETSSSSQETVYEKASIFSGIVIFVVFVCLALALYLRRLRVTNNKQSSIKIEFKEWERMNEA